MTLELSTPLIWIDDWPDAVVDSDTWNQHLKKSKHWDDKNSIGIHIRRSAVGLRG